MFIEEPGGLPEPIERFQEQPVSRARSAGRRATVDTLVWREVSVQERGFDVELLEGHVVGDRQCNEQADARGERHRGEGAAEVDAAALLAAVNREAGFEARNVAIGIAFYFEDVVCAEDAGTVGH